jgi:hypothetical protein
MLDIIRHNETDTFLLLMQSDRYVQQQLYSHKVNSTSKS